MTISPLTSARLSTGPPYSASKPTALVIPWIVSSPVTLARLLPVFSTFVLLKTKEEINRRRKKRR